MKRILIVSILTIMVSCTSEPIAKFNVIGLHNDISIIELYNDSSYVQIFNKNGEFEKDYGKWKGSYELNSILTTYIELEDGILLGSSVYKNENDTLILQEWTIR